MTRLHSRMIFRTAFLALFAAASLLAQTNEETFEQFQFNFSTPGARASAMGRAFIGLADDASAATANPAGLIQLTKPQFYFEYKHTQLRARRLAENDSLSTLRTSTFYEDVDSFSYFNFTIPIRNKVALSFTRHEFLNFKESFVLGAREIPGAAGLPPLNPAQGDREFEGVSYGGSIAVAVNDQFSLGATVTVDQLDAEAVLVRRTPPGIIAGDPDFVTSTLDDEDTKVGVTVGGLFRPSYRFSVGGVYSRGPKFELDQSFVVNNIFVLPPQLVDVGSRRISFNVPDRLGFGAAGRPHDRFLVVFDAVWIRYSDLVDEDFLVLENEVNPALGFPPNPEWTAADYAADDEWEVHAGFEWNVVQGRTNQAFLRGGVFTDPEHGLRFVGDTGNALVNQVESIKFNTTPRDDDTGWTFGGGVTLGRQFQADAAWVSINSFSEFVLSVAVRLP